MEFAANPSLNKIPEAKADLHCHLLPAWDDGPRTFQSSLAIARKAEQSGVRRILVTPHVGRSFGSRPEKSARDIPAATAALENEIKVAGIDIELVAGAEVVLTDADLPRRAVEEPWITIGGQGRYILVESPVDTWPEKANHILFDLALQGITPIIAHPERLRDIQSDLSIAAALVRQGAVLQITARSIVGPDRKAKECAHQLLEAGLVALIASDAHSVRHIFPSEVAPSLHSLVGSELCRQILVDNADAILSGLPLPTLRPVVPEHSFGTRIKGRLLDWMRSRRAV